MTEVAETISNNIDEERLKSQLMGGDVTGFNRDYSEWRRQNPNEKFSWPGCDLHGRVLPGIDLQGADLKDANLRNANLRGANLANANLSNADLKGANLRGADLRGANLQDADLTRVNLANANLSNANLENAELVGVSFEGFVTPYGALVAPDITGANLKGAKIDKSTDLGSGLASARMGTTTDIREIEKMLDAFTSPKEEEGSSFWKNSEVKQDVLEGMLANNKAYVARQEEERINSAILTQAFTTAPDSRLESGSIEANNLETFVTHGYQKTGSPLR